MPSSIDRSALLRAAVAAAGLLALGAAASSAAPPPPGRCPTLSGGQEPEGAQDALPAPLREGQTVGFSELLSLRELLPPEVWKNRHVFFHEGMRLEIGPCHRVYPTTPWFAAATAEHAGRAWIDDAGNLRDYAAGQPFPPEAIDPEAPEAGTLWAWNFEQRYRGSGPVGSFRILDLPSRLGRPETYEGTFFQVRTGHRADLAESEHRVPGVKDRTWVAGGSFDEPFNARHLAWRQLRPEATEQQFSEPDDTFVYVPTMRKVRRAATQWVDGLYMPRYRVSGVDGGGGGLPFGAGEYGPQGSIQPTAALSIAATEHLRKGFVGLSLRPNAYQWRYLGEQEVLAPLNGSRPGYPESPNRNYGESGLSLGSDRWDVRWAVVIEGRARRVAEDVGYLKLYIDYQTQQPLFVVSLRPSRALLDVGILVHRFSGDLPRYPEWPERGPANVFDPVAASFFDAGEGGSGWRRESYDLKSVPVEPDKMRRMTTTDSLARGH